MSKLFTSYNLGNLTLQNRIVMAPMTRSRAIGNIPNELIAEYYAQRGSVGLIITEGTSPSINGLGYARIPGIFSKEQVVGWKKVTDAVHKKGAKIFVQLMHTGRVTHLLNLPKGGEVLAPSAVKLETTKMYVDGKGTLEIPVAKAMLGVDIKHAIQEFVIAAKNAVEAGFDGIELHGANGYLIEQFINPHSNIRTDEYGGSIENRSRFLLDVVEAVTNAIGKQKVGVRLSPFGAAGEMTSYNEVEPTYAYIAKQLSELDIAYVHLVDHASMGAPAVPQTVVDSIRKNFKNTLILSGGYNAERAEAAVEDNDNALVAFGRPLIANPDLVERMKQNLPFNQPKFDLFYTPGAEGYTDYPVFENVSLTF